MGLLGEAISGLTKLGWFIVLLGKTITKNDTSDCLGIEKNMMTLFMKNFGKSLGVIVGIATKQI